MSLVGRILIISYQGRALSASSSEKKYFCLIGGQMAMFMWGTGGKVVLMDMANSTMLKGTNMSVNSRMVKNLDLALNITRTILLMLDGSK